MTTRAKTQATALPPKLPSPRYQVIAADVAVGVALHVTGRHAAGAGFPARKIVAVDVEVFFKNGRVVRFVDKASRLTA